jgi:hypothetical protein
VDLVIVQGFVAGIERPPPGFEEGSTRRVAFVLGTSEATNVDAILDRARFALVFECACKATKSARLRLASSEGVEETSCDEFVASVRDLDLDSPRLPQEVRTLGADASQAAMIVIEPWWKVGGPDPYHDSCTLAAYGRPDVLSAIESAVRDRCAQLGVRVPESIVGAVAPPPRSGFRRILGAIFGRFGRSPFFTGS